MKKVLIGLATLAAMVLPAMAQAQDTRCYLDRDGDRQTCVTSSYNGYDGNYYRRYEGPANYYRGRDRDDLRRREHERQERREHERREWREHHDGYNR